MRNLLYHEANGSVQTHHPSQWYWPKSKYIDGIYVSTHSIMHTLDNIKSLKRKSTSDEPVSCTSEQRKKISVLDQKIGVITSTSQSLYTSEQWIETCSKNAGFDAIEVK